jgi:DNA (cytosine-5)-methyltransferase 1
LDAQWFGVPQRRRRVFVVACLNPGAAGGPQVLPVGASVRRDSEAGSETLPVVAALTANGAGTCGADDNQGQAGHLIPAITGTVTTTWAKGPGNTQVEEGHVIPVAVAAPDLAVLSFDSTFGNQSAVFDNLTPPLKVGSGIGISSPPAVMADLAVRRLTPTECERLMGWPDGWTAEGVDTAGNPVTIADSSRYRMCGNGVATPVAEWVGHCILNAEAER